MSETSCFKKIRFHCVMMKNIVHTLAFTEHDENMGVGMH